MADERRCIPFRERQGRYAVSSGNGPTAPLDPPSTTRKLGEGDEWQMPFAPESTTRKELIMLGIAIIGMSTAAAQLLEAGSTARTSQADAADQLADAIETALAAYNQLTGNRYYGQRMTRTVAM